MKYKLRGPFKKWANYFLIVVTDDRYLRLKHAWNDFSQMGLHFLPTVILCMIAQLLDIVKPMTAPKFQMKSILRGSHQDVRSTGTSECVQMSD